MNSPVSPDFEISDRLFQFRISEQVAIAALGVAEHNTNPTLLRYSLGELIALLEFSGRIPAGSLIGATQVWQQEIQEGRKMIEKRIHLMREDHRKRFFQLELERPQTQNKIV